MTFSDDHQLKEELGSRYDELKDAVGQIKNNLLRVSQLAKQSQPLQLAMQHKYTYSKWDSVHEPYNLVENVLRDDDSAYSGLQPSFDFDLGQTCYVAEVQYWPGDVGASQVELFVSNTVDRWTFVKEYVCVSQGMSKLPVPGEHNVKYLRLKCVNNTRGGQIVSTRHIKVLGVKR